MALRLVSVVGSGCPRIGRFHASLVEQYRGLLVPCPTCVYEIDGHTEPPELLMFFGWVLWNAAALPPFAAELGRYAQAALRLLPVLDQATHANSHLPADLQRFDAFLCAPHGETWPEALVDEVLTLVWQRRPRRRIFISYRRIESQRIADQLYERYHRGSLEVILDQRSMRPGYDFWQTARRELEDSDAMLLLVSPGLTESRWVREEIDFAQTRRIGLLGIIWPADDTINPATSAEALKIPTELQLQLASPAPTGPDARRLTESELAEVDHLLFTGRSQAIAGRIRDLVEGAKDVLTAERFTHIEWQHDGDLRLRRDGAPWLGGLFPFRPNFGELRSWWTERRARAPAGMVVLYPQVDVNDPGELEFRDESDPWCRARTPPVLLCPVRPVPV